MGVVFDGKATVILVGGRGTKAGNAKAGGGCTATQWASSNDISRYTDANGGCVVAVDPCSVSEGGSSKVRLTDAGSFLTVQDGTLCNCIFDEGYAGDDGRYEILDHDTGSGDWIDIDLAYVDDRENAEIYVGGAFPNTQIAFDETDASSYKVEILTNKDDTPIMGDDWDTGGDNLLRKWVIGIDNDGDELTQGNYVTLNGSGMANKTVEVVDTAVGIKHIRFTGATADGLAFDNTAAVYGCFMQNCKFDNNGADGLSLADAFSIGTKITDCVFEDNSTYGLSSAGVQGLDVDNCLFDGNLIHVVPVDGVFDNCIFIDGLCAILGSTGFIRVSNSVFYNQTIVCVRVGAAAGRLAEWNNIYSPFDSDADYAVEINVAGDVVYSDYSCVYCLEEGKAMNAGYAWPTGYKGNNSIEVDPLFVDYANGDFRLKAGSPCLNTGKRNLGNGFTNQGYSDMGSWQRKSYLRYK